MPADPVEVALFLLIELVDMLGGNGATVDKVLEDLKRREKLTLYV